MEVDARGLSCPLPLLHLRKALHGMQPGNVVRLRATDPHSRQDIARFCEKSAHTLLDQVSSGDEHTFWVRKAADQAPAASLFATGLPQ